MFYAWKASERNHTSKEFKRIRIYVAFGCAEDYFDNEVKLPVNNSEQAYVMLIELFNRSTGENYGGENWKY